MIEHFKSIKIYLKHYEIYEDETYDVEDVKKDVDIKGNAK